jgi:type VI secretion system protein ImpH
MATSGRTIDPSIDQSEVWNNLKREPWAFEFFQAVRLLERLSEARSRVGYFVAPSTEAVHFKVNPLNRFPGSDIESLKCNAKGPPEMSVNFMGLTGPSGLLPDFYDELLERGDNPALRDFLDIFNHRITSLFYRAWSKYRFQTAFENGEQDPLARCLLAFLGLGTPGLEQRQRQAVPDDALLYYAGLMAAHARSAVGLQQILSDYFEVPVEIEQFAGRWRRINRPAQTCLSEKNRLSEKLSYGVIVGDEVWDPQSSARIKLGPLPMQKYLDFLPTGSAYPALKALVRFYSGESSDFEAQLILRREEVQACELGADSGMRLGWVTWVKTAPFERDPGEKILQL